MSSILSLISARSTPLLILIQSYFQSHFLPILYSIGFPFSFFWNNRAYARKKRSDKVNYVASTLEFGAFSLKNGRQYPKCFRKYRNSGNIYLTNCYMVYYIIFFIILLVEAHPHNRDKIYIKARWLNS